MKVLQAVGWFYPDSLGGTEVYVHGLSRRLRAAGHDVLIAAPDPAAQQPHSYTYDGFEVFRYPVPPRPSRDEVQGRVPVRGTESLHEWIRTERPDVLHAHTFVTGLGVAELEVARSVGARIIVTTHSARLGYLCQRGTLLRDGAEPCDGHVRPGRCASCALQQRGVPAALSRAAARLPLPLQRAAYELPGSLGTAVGMAVVIERNIDMQRRMLELVDRFAVLTEFAAGVIVANGGPQAKTVLVPLGIGHDDIEPKPGPELAPTQQPVRIGYLGRFEAIKGVFDLARALTLLPRDLPIRVEFRGPALSDAERVSLGRLQRMLAGDARISFEPPVEPAAALSVLKGYDLLCCPSLSHEGGPTVALEAHAVGTPVLGTRIGRLAEVIEDGVNGRLVEPGDWRGLAAALAHAVLDPGATIDRWRRELRRPPNMDDVAAQYLDMYQTIVECAR